MTLKSALRDFSEWTAALLFSGSKRHQRLMNLAVFLLLLLPLLLAGTYSYIRSYQELTSSVYARRQTLAYLAAATLQQKLDHLKDIGASLATRPRVYQLAGEGKWNEAVQFLRSVPKDFPFIERLFLTDPTGTLRADVPELPGMRGRNFAYRDWYQGVSRSWETYVSDVYSRAAEPSYNVIAAATPIKSENGRVVGILVLQLRLKALAEWAEKIDVGYSGFVYFVDRTGQIVAHPKFPPDVGIVDFSTVPSVQKALKGERGIEVVWNPIEKEERLSAYEPVPGYGWGVVVQQPTSMAFEVRNDSLRRLSLAYGLILLSAAALASLILHVISERRRVGEEMRKLNEDLNRRAVEIEAANKELEAFTYSVSHDLRAPLRAIDGFSRILLEKHGAEMSADAKRFQNLIRDNAQQMGRLIDDLLAFSRLGRQALKRQPIAPADIVREALHGLGHELRNGSPEISLQELPGCRADPSLLKQVYVNLLSNAVKYSRSDETARIEIGCLTNNSEPVYYVRDNGVGFDMKYADKLFGVFQRLHRAEEYEGTGVGLAIVQRIVHRHGGRVWAEAEVDKGATFYFTLGGRAQ